MLSVEAVETFFSAITFALTLLLVFKTNSSYARWWEARAKVGLLTSTAHDLARAVSQELQFVVIHSTAMGWCTLWLLVEQVTGSCFGSFCIRHVGQVPTPTHAESLWHHRVALAAMYEHILMLLFTGWHAPAALAGNGTSASLSAPIKH
jgi:hypothetical protein